MNDNERKAADEETIKQTEEAGELMEQIEQEILVLDPAELRSIREHIEFVKWRRDQQNYIEFQENLTQKQ